MEPEQVVPESFDDEDFDPIVVEDVVEENDDNDDSEFEEEDECRVCRGPAEEGRPLYAPCKCSGSIGLTHQDCLMSWLEVTRGDGRCELCKTKFLFDPQYAENAPDHLPAHEVFLGLTSRAVARWLPLTLRISLSITVWLVVAPFLTSCLYHGWIHRPSSIPARMKRDLIPSDIVSGAIIAAIIIISFLSLMSFADFLRVHWQQGPNNNNNRQEGRNENDPLAGVDDANNSDVQGGEKVDETILKLVESRNAARQERIQEEQQEAQGNTDVANLIQDDEKSTLEAQAAQGRELAMLREARRRQNNSAALIVDDDDDDDDDDTGDENEIDMPDRDAYLERLRLHDRGIEDEAAAFVGRNEDILRDLNDRLGDILVNQMDPLENNVEPEPREEPLDPMDPAMQDDQADMEINVALDELLGLRGPVSTLIRNLLWLLAFNATYLGIFAFVPKAVGSAVYSGLLNTTLCDKLLKTIPFVHSEDEEKVTLLTIISSINEESSERDTTFRLPDATTVTLGYFSIATTIVLIRFGWIFSQKFRKRFNPLSEEQTDRTPTVPRNDVHRRPHVLDDHMDDNDPAGAAGATVAAALDATVAVVKVGILLFLKMFLLPLVLGLCLDVSTMPLFGHEVSDRIAFAGSNLFSFILLHWVAGITFMLLVTVFLLQLREVAHPDLLARLIRPQEPQPDLLGNLMNETVGTHMKRMFLSLGIYAPLLVMHVFVPVKLFQASGLGDSFTFFHLKFWHIVMPQMQIPIELIIFHLSMLALLERYKNTIGGLQHSWMVFMCRKMGLTEYMLPRSVSKFELVGTKEIFSKETVNENEGLSSQVDPFWYELAEKGWGRVRVDHFIESNIENTDVKVPVAHVGESKENGQRVLKSEISFIRLPENDPAFENRTHLLPAKLGRYSLNHAIALDEQMPPKIEFWKEIPGDEIPRPPEGWDDLGAGGAFVQGRWAWGKEKKSTIEWSVANRTPFKISERHRRPLGLMLKVVGLFVLSWVAITSTVLGLISTPLAFGRSFYYLFRIPERFIHDPLAFCIGGSIFFPLSSLMIRSTNLVDDRPTKSLRDWISRFSLPPRQKLLVVLESFILWALIAPLTLGALYEIVFVKTSKWFGREEPLVDVSSLLLSWLVGAVILNIWALFAYNSVFTREFWVNIGNGILEPPDENIPGNLANNNGAAGDDDDVDGNNEGNGLDWQGKRGRVAVFFGIWRSIILKWEWESVDRVGLLQEFARPITKQIASALVGSSLFWQFNLTMAPLLLQAGKGGFFVPLFGLVERSLFRMILFRICTIIHVTVQLCSAFRGRIQGWFQLVHEAARDDRYLIGEILMNYDPNNTE